MTDKKNKIITKDSYGVSVSGMSEPSLDIWREVIKNSEKKIYKLNTNHNR